MVIQVKNIEELFLKIFKVTVLLVMGSALLAILVLLVTAAFQYSQSPKEPAPAQKAVVKEIKLEDLMQFLIEKEKRENNKGGVTEQQPVGPAISLRFQEDATVLFRCASEFGKQVGVEFQDVNDAVNAQKLQQIRGYIENSANGSNLRRETWVKAVVKFVCTALTDSSIIAMKKEGKVKNLFFPIMAFHLQTWDFIEAEKVKFERGEENRVASERGAEALRVAAAKAFAVMCLIAAASAFGLFMLLALYLLAAKIENDLREINGSINSAAALARDKKND